MIKLLDALDEIDVPHRNQLEEMELSHLNHIAAIEQEFRRKKNSLRRQHKDKVDLLIAIHGCNHRDREGKLTYKSVVHPLTLATKHICTTCKHVF